MGKLVIDPLIAKGLTRNLTRARDESFDVVEWRKCEGRNKEIRMSAEAKKAAKVARKKLRKARREGLRGA